MTINFLSVKPLISQIKTSNIKNQNISFLGRKNDDEFQRSVVFTEEEYQKRLEKNPNTAFLYDPKLTQDQKEAMIKKNPTLKTTKELVEKLGKQSYLWVDERFFEIDNFTPQRNGEYKLPIRIFDMSNPINKENFEKLEKAKNHILTSEEISRSTNVSSYEINRNVKRGLIHPFTLKNKETQTQEKTQFIDITDEKNQAGFDRAKKLSPQRSPHSKGFWSDKPYLVNVLELAKLGYGTAKDLANLVKEKRYPGEIKKVTDANGNAKVVVKVDISKPMMEEELFIQKKGTCKSITELCEETKIPREKIESAILDGSLKAIKEYLITDEMTDLYINMKDLENVDEITRMTFEQKIEEDLIKAHKEETKETQRAESSLMMKIAWHLCPKTQTNAKGLVAQNKEFQELFDKKRKLEEEFVEREEKGEDTLDLAIEYGYFLIDAEPEMKKFFKNMWNTSGTEEFTQAMKKAKEIIQIYKTQGIDAIEDIEIRCILEDL